MVKNKAERKKKVRKFSSYGPINTRFHYYAPREEILDLAHRQLIGENPEDGGHYITVWGPRQTGKTWTLNNIFAKIRSDERFDVVKVELETLKTEKNIGTVLSYIENDIAYDLNKDVSGADTPDKFQKIFLKGALDKPLVLILDEFDALEEEAISAIVGVFRNIYNIRQNQADRKTGEKKYLLHSAALIGVRAVLGVENRKGSPFNVQRSLHIPNLTFDEVEEMFRWHERESGQRVEQEVIDRLFYETKGQPGLTCWFGELLTEGWDQFRVAKEMPVDMGLFKRAYHAATSLLPNNNILNIISKAKQEPFKKTVLELFGTKRKMPFKYDKPDINFLYMNGIISGEHESETESYVKFSSPFVQKRLFNYFADEIFEYTDEFHDPFEPLDDAITEDSLNIRNIIKLYRKYLVKNRDWIFSDAPRRSDLRVYEAVFHFNLYMYLSGFIRRFGGEVYPEFPTGNGKIDLIVKYAGKTYGIEVKSYTDRRGYSEALTQAARYGDQLKLKEITLVFFVESINDENRAKYEADFFDDETGVNVTPVFVETG
ncbi:conserved hypothetical protein [Candidatus Desulfarcum epimagneticum]|uniref:ORC1/DEAH AAA+ ATPase domain-containing protein n=1 Tax=uncultured Desulfobacteraceae bacterium TaxID=218296 RepID=A0A484HDI3_9BACT|nr:conserved hypothetical protein [uncultured Desulfobacteraceae bacterium]